MLVRKDLSRDKLQGQVAVGRWGETINMRSKKPESFIIKSEEGRPRLFTLNPLAIDKKGQDIPG